MTYSMNFLNLILTLNMIGFCLSQENSIWHANHCPSVCRCNITERSVNDHVVKWMKTTECNAKELRELPGKIPRETQALVLEENEFQDFHELLGRLLELPYLEEIVVADNAFKNFHSNCTLTSVSNVDASNNDLMEFSATDFASFPNLNQLSLQRNLISHIDQNLCSKKTSTLRSLVLSHNLIDNLAWMKNCSSLGDLYRLDVSGNKQQDQTLPNSSFSSLTCLKILLIEDMELKLIQTDAFSGLDDLEILDLDYNFLDFIPTNALSKLKNLKSLSLNGNQVKQITAGDFFDLPKLEIVELTNLPLLQIIDQMSFNNLPQLKSILLFHNPRLSYIDGNAFENCSNIETLDLHNTLIATILRTTIASLPSLKDIDLSDNQLNCDCMMDWAQEWTTSMENVEANDNSKSMVCASPQQYRNSQLRDVIFNSDDPCLPKIQPTFPIRLNVEQHNSLVLDCRAFGEPKPVIMWIMPDGNAMYANATNVSNNNVASLDSKGTLTVKNPESATYKCIAANSNGKAVREVRVIVLADKQTTQNTKTTQRPLQEETITPGQGVKSHAPTIKTFAQTTATATQQVQNTSIQQDAKLPYEIASKKVERPVKDIKILATTSETVTTTVQHEQHETNPNKNAGELLNSLKIRRLKVTATSALITWYGLDLNSYSQDYQIKPMTLTVQHNGRLVYKEGVNPFILFPNMTLKASEFSITTLHPGSQYEVCLSVKYSDSNKRKACTTVHTLPYTTESTTVTNVSVAIFLTLMGLLMLTTALACCGKTCHSSGRKISTYEKLEENTNFDDIYQPLIQQTSKNRKEKLINTNITATFI